MHGKKIQALKAAVSPPPRPTESVRMVRRWVSTVNIMEFCKAFQCPDQNLEPGLPTPVVITVYSDRSFNFETKSTCFRC